LDGRGLETNGSVGDLDFLSVAFVRW